MIKLNIFGGYTLIDDEDLELVSQYNWFVFIPKDRKEV